MMPKMPFFPQCYTLVCLSAKEGGFVLPGAIKMPCSFCQHDVFVTPRGMHELTYGGVVICTDCARQRGIPNVREGL